MTTREAFGARDAVVKAFSDSYRESGVQFPAECGESDIASCWKPPIRFTRSFSPAQRRLGRAGQVPAHPRRVAANGERHQRAVGTRRQELDDHAGLAAARRAERAVQAARLSAAPMGCDHQRRHRRRLCPRLLDRQGKPEPAALRRHAAGGTHDISRHRTACRRAEPRHRGSAGAAGRRATRGDTGKLRRRAAAARRRGNIPLPRRQPLLVRHAADGDAARRAGRARPRRGRGVGEAG